MKILNNILNKFIPEPTIKIIPGKIGLTEPGKTNLEIKLANESLHNSEAKKFVDYYKFCEANKLTLSNFKNLQKFFNQGAV